jgi:hypothetical protein
MDGMDGGGRPFTILNIILWHLEMILVCIDLMQAVLAFLGLLLQHGVAVIMHEWADPSAAQSILVDPAFWRCRLRSVSLPLAPPATVPETVV